VSVELISNVSSTEFHCIAWYSKGVTFIVNTVKYMIILISSIEHLLTFKFLFNAYMTL
jgi:hypothetical protein